VELKRTKLAVARERAVLVGASTEEAALAGESLDEIRRLAETAGAQVVGTLTQHRSAADPATRIGRGKVEELAALCRELQADLIIMDVDLSPGQVRNIEKATDRKVVDRTEMILDIFAQGARTSEAGDQVELAQLEYAFPRLKRMWTHLGRIEGGIGMRGPGERQLETDRRLIRKRIQALKGRIRANLERRAREVEARAEEVTVCLVGYTNAGKSTLMNALTGAGVKAEDKLFSTLDTRTRVCGLGEGRRILLSDTVGFIRHLPHHLVASFRATLEEARHADLLLHVVDASAPSAEHQMDAVMEVLRELQCAEHSILSVYNKMDLVADESHLPLLRRKFGDGVALSARTGRGLDDLRARIRDFLDRNSLTVTLEFPASDGRIPAYVAEHGETLSADYTDTHGRLRVRMPPRCLGVVRKLGAKVSRLRPPAETDLLRRE